jgi:hypothetical protein
MNKTLGAPSFARSGAGQAGADSPMVRPMRPGKVVPGLYSFSAMLLLLCLVYAKIHRRSFCKWKIFRFLAESIFEQPTLDYRAFPHFEVRNSLEAQTEQCAARLQRRNIDLKGWTINVRLR